MITESTKVYYVLMLEGKEISKRYESKHLLELEKTKLPESQQLAEIHTVTDDGKQVLLG